MKLKLGKNRKYFEAVGQNFVLIEGEIKEPKSISSIIRRGLAKGYLVEVKEAPKTVKETKKDIREVVKENQIKKTKKKK